MKNAKKKIETANEGSNEKPLIRRDMLRTLALAGAGAATLVGFQNCSPVSFKTVPKNSPSKNNDPEVEPESENFLFDCRNPNLLPDYPFYHEPGKINGHTLLSQQNPGALGSVASEHKIDARFYKADYLEPNFNQTQTQHLLTVDVGSSALSTHPVGNANFQNNNTLADIYVFEKISGDYRLLFWRRFGASDFRASNIFLLDDAVVARKSTLKVVARCVLHGYWQQDISLSGSAANYSSAVPNHSSGQDFGGTDIFRPYVAQSATGGQTGLNIAQHSPSINIVNNDTVDVYLGPSGARHSSLGDNHYVGGAMLFDQNGHLLAPHQVLNLSRANGSHVFRFTGLNLSGRGVDILRAVCQDTFNGHFMGFKNLS